MNIHVVLQTEIFKLYKMQETKLCLTTSLELCNEHLDTTVQGESSLFKNLTEPHEFTDLCHIQVKALIVFIYFPVHESDIN
jgi:hypothetical protein